MSTFSKRPGVSVCIPTYNQSGYLEEAVNSILAQTHEVKQIIVSDDCSTDDTAEILKNLSERIPNLVVISQPVNLGITDNTNACLKASKTEYTVRLDSDDKLLPEYVATIVNLLENHPSAAFGHANVRQIDENGVYTKDRTLFRTAEFESADVALRLAGKGYRVAANILMFRTACLESLNYLDGFPNCAEDYYLNVFIAAAGYGNVFSPLFLSEYRVWSGVANMRNKRKLVELKGLRRIFDELLQPASRSRGEGRHRMMLSRSMFVMNHSDCLSKSWYSRDEKHDLKDELLGISSSPIAKTAIYLHQHGFGWMVEGSIESVNKAKQIIKKYRN